MSYISVPPPSDSDAVALGVSERCNHCKSESCLARFCGLLTRYGNWSSKAFVLQFCCLTFAFAITGTASATSSQLSVNPISLPFSNVSVGSSSTLGVTLTSTGSAAVTIYSAGMDNGIYFMTSGQNFPLTLNPQQSVTLQVIFIPTSTGAVGDTLVISSNSTTSANGNVYVSVSGTGVTGNQPGGSGNGQLTMSVSSLAFGNVAVGSSSTLGVTLTSSGAGPLTIYSVTMQNGIPDGFTVSGASFPLTLNPQQSVKLQVTFSPASTFYVSDAVMIQSNSSTATNGVNYIGTSGAGVNASGPQLSVNPTSLSFGDVTVGSNATLPLTLASVGSGAITIKSASISGTGFTMSVATFPVTLNPQTSVTLQVKFAPTVASTATGSVTVSSSASTATVILSGTGASGQHQVSLSWQAPTNSPVAVSGYNIYRATGTSTSFQLLNAVSATSYVDSSVQSGAGYTYYIESASSSGVLSTPSNEVSVTIP